MSFTYIFKEVLQEYDGTLYKMILLTIKNENGKFEHRALPIGVLVDDGVNKVAAFMYDISGNQKELAAYFTTDAFVGLESISTTIFGYAGDLVHEITGFNVGSLIPLPTYFNSYTFVNADNNWLADL